MYICLFSKLRKSGFLKIRETNYISAYYTEVILLSKSQTHATANISS